MSIIEQLSLTGKGIISLIGAGGKTSLMFQLAKDLAESKKRVLTTTTTKIFMPERNDSPETIFADSIDAFINKCKNRLQSYSHFSAGSRYDARLGKVIGFIPETIDQLWQADLFDWIIVEADGAKRRPLKATGPHEPVLPSRTSAIALVVGLDAVGRPLDGDHVHRAEIFSINTRCPIGSIIDEQAVATAIMFEIKKSKTLIRPIRTIAVLNKADTPERITYARRIEKMVSDQKIIDRVITTRLKRQIKPKT